MAADFDTIVNLAKRRGFVFQSSEIYGGTAVRVRLRTARRRAAAQRQGAVVALDRADARRRRRHRLGHSPVSRRCGSRPATSRRSPIPSSNAASATAGTGSTSWRIPTPVPHVREPGTFTEPKEFNLMFKTHMGPIESDDNVVYLRPGDGPGHLHQLRERPADRPTQKDPVRDRTDRQVVPQRDHPRPVRVPYPRVRADGDGVLLPPGRCAPDVFAEWVGDPQELVPRPRHDAREPPLPPARSPTNSPHYAAAGTPIDVEYLFPWGWDELEGIANRTDFDLRAHMERSGEDLTYFDPGDE